MIRVHATVNRTAPRQLRSYERLSRFNVEKGAGAVVGEWSVAKRKWTVSQDRYRLATLIATRVARRVKRSAIRFGYSIANISTPEGFKFRSCVTNGDTSFSDTRETKVEPVRAV